MTILLFALWGSLVALNILDGHSTWMVLRPKHLNREKNPLARWIFSRLGIVWGIVVSELLWIGFITCVFFLLLKGSNPLALKMLLGLLALGNLVFLALVINNYLVWRRIRKRDSQAGN